MTLLITVFAACITTVIWYKNAPDDSMKLGFLCLMYWGASLMWMCDAIFEYKYFDRYFTGDDRDAFFIREQGTNKLLGFVMISTYIQKENEGHSIAEFMVIPKYRRCKIGKKVAFKCFLITE